MLDAQRSRYTAQQTLIGLRLSEQSNRITLYKVMGGGDTVQAQAQAQAQTEAQVPAGTTASSR